MTVVALPWPPRELSPNARPHWAAKARAVKQYRQACAWACKAAGLTAPAVERIHLWVDFYPPSRRKIDDDNLIASFKAGRDGIADALGIDDARFVVHPFVRDEIGGMVKVRLSA